MMTGIQIRTGLVSNWMNSCSVHSTWRPIDKPECWQISKLSIATTAFTHLMNREMKRCSTVPKP